MTTLIFIHGTGVRQPEYDATFEIINQKVAATRADIKVIPCCWGEIFGSKLNANGASIPLYDSTLALNQRQEENEDNLLWEQLYQDPLFELRVLSLQPASKNSNNPFVEQPSEQILTYLQNFNPDHDLQTKLEMAGLAIIFDEARKTVLNSIPFNSAIVKITDATSEHYAIISRAIVAQAMYICEEHEQFLPILSNADLRDNIIKLLSQSLGDVDLSVGSWIKDSLSLLLTKPMTYLAKRKRGSITDAFSSIPCDIILYQSRGASIREYIQSSIEKAESPVVLLTHSLGGVACVDLLAQTFLPKVKLLVTAGSQAPFLYEINALCGLKYGDPLPDHFPEWLNIYDLQDFLSFIGEKIFQNKIQDVLVDNRQPFPKSHGAYWQNEATWKAIFPKLP